MLLRIEHALDPSANELAAELLAQVAGLDQILDDGGLGPARLSA